MKKQIAGLTLALCLVSLGCGSLNKSAGNSILALRTAYTTANQTRNEYCRALQEPKPIDLCKEQGAAYKALHAASLTVNDATQLLYTYETTKDKSAREKLQAFLPVIAAQTIEILRLSFPTKPNP